MLPDCLQSVRGIASEIIVVDTGSADRTREIAQRFGATVIDSPWQHDFAKARNIALAAAKFPWILSIDADERLYNPDTLLAAIHQASPQTGGFLLEVLSPARRADGGTDVFSIQLLRLFRNDTRIRFEGIIHEQVLESILTNGWKIEFSGVRLDHLGYNLAPDAMRKKQQRNLTLLNASIAAQPTDAYATFQRAKTYLALGDLFRAEDDIRTSLRLAGEKSVVRPQALNHGGIIAFQRGNPALAAERARESLKLIPYQAFAQFVLGEALTATGDFAGALSAYRAMISADSLPDALAHISGEYRLPPEQQKFRLGRSLSGLGKWNEAEAEFLAGLEINPNDVGCRVGLSNVAMRRGDITAARHIIEETIRLAPDRTDLLGILQQIEQTVMSRGQGMEDKQEGKDKKTSDSRTAHSSPLVSLCMIVKNEEHFLPGCLESVRGVVDEIIIADTGSTDRTREIAVAAGAKVVDFPWIGDFSAARNESLRHANGTWVLYLDADERLHDTAKLHLRPLLEHLPDTVGGLICTIISPHRQIDDSSEEHRGGYPRIFRNMPEVRFQGRVHEQITPSLLAIGKNIVLSEVIIEHLGYNQSLEVLEQKTRRNYQLLIRHVQEEPINAYAWFQLGQTLSRMNLVKEAEQALQFAMDLGSLTPTIAASATAALAQIAGNAKRFAEALGWAEKSLEYAPEQLYARHLRAYSLLYLGRAREAEAVFNDVLERRKNFDDSTHAGFDIAIPEKSILDGLAAARKAL